MNHPFVLRYCLALLVLIALGCDESSETPTRQLNTGEIDTAETDTGETDTGETDTTETDTGETDTGETDTAETDTTETDTTEMEDESEPNETLLFAPLDEGGEVVSTLDVNRYMGTWYEIATTPSIQQRLCFGTQAIYSFNEAEGWVDVTNRCTLGSADGQLQEIQGRAEIVDSETQAKLAVFFFDQGSPYWVVGLDGTEGDDPYRWAVVSVPSKSSIWILSRSPRLDPGDRETLNAYLVERGFDIDRLSDTPQP